MKVIFDPTTEIAYLDDDSEPAIAKNGKLYYLTAKDEQDIATKEAIYLAGAYQRALNKVYDDRIAAYGTYGEQLDMMYHDGIEAWKDHIAQVKTNNPKPE